MMAIASNLERGTNTHNSTFPKEEAWVDRELLGCKFKDARLGKRFQILLKQLSNGVGESIPLVCQDWANTKAAYRFFSNDRVSEKEILAGHFQAVIFKRHVPVFQGRQDSF